MKECYSTLIKETFSKLHRALKFCQSKRVSRPALQILDYLVEVCGQHEARKKMYGQKNSQHPTGIWFISGSMRIDTPYLFMTYLKLLQMQCAVTEWAHEDLQR